MTTTPEQGVRLAQRARKAARASASVQLDLAKAAIRADNVQGARDAISKATEALDALEPASVTNG
jgi:hypothetical protein